MLSQAMTTGVGVEEGLLTEYLAHLAAARYGTVGFVEALVLSPRIEEHRLVRTLGVVPHDGVDGQYPGKQWWQGKHQPGRQISAVNAEILDVLEVPYDVPGDNLIIRGIDLSRFEPGDTIRIGDVLLTATPTPHRPCSKFAARTSLTKMKAISSARYRGTMFDALRPGSLHIGDAVERLILTTASRP